MSIDDPNNQNPGQPVEPEGYNEFALTPIEQPQVDQLAPPQTGAMPSGFQDPRLQEPGLERPIIDPIDILGGMAAAPISGTLMGVGEEILGNEIGAIGSDIGRQTAWRGARPVMATGESRLVDNAPGAIQKVEQGIANEAKQNAAETALRNTAAYKEEVAAANKATSAAKRAAYAKKQGYADGGPVAPTGVDSGQNSEPTGYNEFIAPEMQQEQYGTPTQQAITGLEGAAQGVAGPLAPLAERALGVTPEAIRERQEANPVTHGVGEAAGLLGSLATGVGEAAIAGHVGEAALAHIAPNLGKIGSAAAKMAIENGIIGGSDEVSKMVWQDPNQTAQTALINTGLAAGLGGAIGGGAAAISPLWKATMGAKTGGILKALSDKVGGVEGSTGVDALINDAIETSGMDIAPEVKMGMTQHPELLHSFQTLMESDSSSGLKAQEAVKQFKKGVGDSIVTALGKTPEEVESLPKISKYENGKAIGETLAKEYKEKLDPIAKEFEALKSKYKNAPLEPDTIEKGVYNPQAPYDNIPDVRRVGTGGQIANKLTDLASKEGWIGGDATVQRELNRTLRQLPKVKTLGELGDLMTQVGNNTKSTLPFGMQTPLSRAGSLIKNVLRDAESDLAIQHLGEEAPELVTRYKAARDAYKAQAGLQQSLNDRLKVSGSVSGFAKGLREMAQTDGESVLNRLSGKNDAQLLSFLQENFPETAQALKEHHIASVLEHAISKAPQGETLAPKHLFTALDKMSPEMKQFVINPEVASKLDSLRALSEALPARMNPSGTAKTLMARMAHLPASAGAIASMIHGGNAAVGFVLGSLGKYLGREAPDAVKLAMLKFMGSDKPINVGAFKHMVDFMHHAVEGENRLSKAAKNVFKEDGSIMPEHAVPTERDRSKIEKALSVLRMHPGDMLNAGGNSHYMPEHGGASAQMHQNVANYLNSQRPQEDKSSPFDTKSPITSIKKAQWTRTLDIAQQPLVVLSHVKNGSLTPQDVISLKSMYPDLYNRLTTKVMTSAMDHAAKGHPVSYKTRMGLSLLTGQPMDSTFSPMLIQAAQPKASHVPQDARSASPMGGSPKHSTNSLNKLPGAYRTPSQAREQKAASEKH